MSRPNVQPRDIVSEIVLETIRRLAEHDELAPELLSRVSLMLRDGVGKQGRDLKALLTGNDGRE